MHLALLSEIYIMDMDRFIEAIFVPSNGDGPAKVTLYLTEKHSTEFTDDEAITVWHRLKDVLAAQKRLVPVETERSE